MKSSRCAAFAAALVGVVGAGSVASAQDRHADHATRRLAGRVLELASKRPVRGAAVVIGEPSMTTVSDQQGYFILQGLPARKLRISVRAIGYGPVTETIDFSETDRDVVVALEPRVTTLDSLVVSGRSADAELRQDRAQSRLNADDLARQRGQTLGETLKDLPGVAVIQYGPSIAKPVVRGLHSQRIAVMNGAVPQEGQQWGAEHAPEIDAFAANEIEVIRGAGGVLYGSNAIGGVVRVLPRPLPTSGRWGGELQTNVFANNRQGAASLLFEGAGLTLPLLRQVSWRVQGTYRRGGDARTPDYFLPNTGFEETNWSAALGMTRRWGSSEIDYSHFGTNLGMYRGAHVGNLNDLERAMANPVTANTFSYRITRPDQVVKHDLVSWRTRLGLSDGAQLHVDYGYQYNSRNEYDSRGFAASNPRPAFGLRLITHSIEVKLNHASTGGFAGTVGIAGLRQGNLSPGRSFLIPQYRLHTAGLFGLEQWTSGRWTLSAGARFDYRWQRAFQFGAPVVISPDDTSAYHGLSGSLAATYRLAEGWSLAATVGRMWRAPNVSERFSQGVHHGTAQYEIGDSSLASERTLAIDATLRHVGARTRMEVSAYSNRIDDYIYLRPRAPIQTVRGAYPAYQYESTDAKLRGLEASVQFDPSSSLSFYASGTLVRGVDRSTGEALFDIPADRLSLSARVYGPRGGRILDPYLELGTTLVRHQDRVPSTTVYRLPTDGYGLVSLEIGAREVRLLGQKLEVNVTAKNLFDHRYRDYLSRYRLYVDDVGRDVIVRVRTTFGRRHR